MNTHTQLLTLLFLLNSLTFSVFAQAPPPSISVASNTNGLVQYNIQNAGTDTQVFTLFGDGTFSLQKDPKHKFVSSSIPYTTEAWFLKPYDPNIPPKRTVTVNVSGTGSTYQNPVPKMSGNLDLFTSWSTAKGYETFYIIAFKNTNSTLQSGCIEFEYDTDQITVNTEGIKVYNNWLSNEQVFTLNPFNIKKIKWSFNGLASGETRYVYIPITPNNNIGDIVNINYRLDCSITGNISKSSSFVVQKHPHDPNSKTVSTACILSNYNQEQFLEYTVRFFNDGESFAENVYIEDLLTSKLDVSSIEVIDSEYNNYETQIIPNLSDAEYPNILMINFKGLNLPGTQQINGDNEFYTYEEASTYIKFRIKAEPGLNDGGFIKNRVGIIFDDQPVIYTGYANTFIAYECISSQRVNSTSSGELTGEASVVKKRDGINIEEDLLLKAYPNPFTDRLRITLDFNKERPENFLLKIIDYSGNVVKELYHNKESVKTFQHTFHFKSLPKGLYLVVLQTGQKTVTKKIINY